MKTIRMILPVVAFLFAIGAALTSVSAKTNATTIDVSYVKPAMGSCDIVGECTFDTNPPLCKDGNIQLYEFISTSSCPSVAHGTFDPE